MLSITLKSTEDFPVKYYWECNNCDEYSDVFPNKEDVLNMMKEHVERFCSHSFNITEFFRKKDIK